MKKKSCKDHEKCDKENYYPKCNDELIVCIKLVCVQYNRVLKLKVKLIHIINIDNGSN